MKEKVRVSSDLLFELCPTAKKDIVYGVVDNLRKYMSRYEINTNLRLAHFLAQAAHESAHFRTLEEYASGDAYDSRTDLGNTPELDGDGRLYKGRGIFQITGRANYKSLGAKLGFDLENNPSLAATPEVSVLTALEYWKSRGLNKLADDDNVKEITKRINGWYNGLAEREMYLAKAKFLLGCDLTCG